MSAGPRAPRAGRRPDGRRQRTPLPALLVILFATALLVPLSWTSISEDVALSATTTGRLLAGGEDVRTKSGGTLCRGGPVEFEVDGTTYAGTTPVRGVRCPTGDEVESVTIRYDPDDPDEFSNNGRQYLLYGLLVLAALGFVVALVATLRRLWERVSRRT